MRCYHAASLLGLRSAGYAILLFGTQTNFIDSLTGAVYGPVVPEMAEFWIMSTYFPAGLACFQAANSQLLHVAKLQEKYATPGALDQAVRQNNLIGPQPWHKRLAHRFRQTDSRVRMMIYISIALVFQASIVAYPSAAVC